MRFKVLLFLIMVILFLTPNPLHTQHYKPYNELYHPFYGSLYQTQLINRLVMSHSINLTPGEYTYLSLRLGEPGCYIIYNVSIITHPYIRSSPPFVKFFIFKDYESFYNYTAFFLGETSAASFDSMVRVDYFFRSEFHLVLGPQYRVYIIAIYSQPESGHEVIFDMFIYEWMRICPIKDKS